ncbi:MAG: MBL fold metallo-hydrolase [Chloroflexota bacterium]|nr:MBL fold metallo-hydrolase [Chloroflexota bacterium]
MEIAPGVHQVRMLGADSFLIAEERLTLIDAGMLGSTLMLQRYLRRIGRRIEELERVVCTHGHPDHMGGVGELVRRLPDVSVLIHADDIAGLRLPLRGALGGPARTAVRRGRLIQYLTRAPADPILVDGDEVLPVLGGLQVVHTPGHTPGSICLYAPRHRLLFTGDVLQVIRGRLTYASAFFSHDHAGARSSVERLAVLDVETIALSHYPPWRQDCNAMLGKLAALAAG